MFSYLQKITKGPVKDISIDDYVNLIKTPNPSVDYIRSLEYGSSEYTDSKPKLLAGIMVAGKFNYITESSIIQSNGLIFFDIDNTDNLDNLITELFNVLPITLLYKSVSGRGIHFFIKVKDLNPNNYKSKQNFIKEYLKEFGIVVDNSAKGFARKAFISYDPNIIYNQDIQEIDLELLGYDEGSISSGNNKENRLTDQMLPSNDIKDTNATLIKPNATLNGTYATIPIHILLQQIRLESKYEKEIDGDWVIEPQPWERITYPQKIQVGRKRSTFIRHINQLIFLNPNITDIQIYSWLIYLNKNHTTQRANEDSIKKLVADIASIARKNGTFKPKRIKKIHFNKESNMTPKEKQSKAASLNGQMRRDATLNKILTEIKRLESINHKYTQKIVSSNLNIHIGTVKRYWSEIIQILEGSISSGNIKENRLTDQMLPKSKIITYKYKGILQTTIEILDSDLDEFHNIIETLKRNDIPLGELTLLELGRLDKYKTEYLWNRWADKHKFYQGLNDDTKEATNDK